MGLFKRKANGEIVALYPMMPNKMQVDRAIRNQGQSESVYDSRGLLFI